MTATPVEGFTKDFFAKLTGEYPRYEDLYRAANKQAVEDLDMFPPGFRMRDYLMWAVERGWVKSLPNGRGIEVAVG